jgi:ATP/maltotriose-dependent transcriptional regulator MalT
VFVLGDYHLLDDATVNHTLTFLFDYLPPTLHFVLSGRAAPPLQLGSSPLCSLLPSCG